MGGTLAERTARSRNRPPNGGRDARGQPGLHSAQSPDRSGDQAAVNHDDFAPFEELLTVLAKPFEDQPEYAAYAAAEPEQRVLQTFCGT